MATEMKMRPECSYDFCLLEIPKWTEDNQKEMERLHNESRKYVKEEEGKTRVSEWWSDEAIDEAA